MTKAKFDDVASLALVPEINWQSRSQWSCPSSVAQHLREPSEEAQVRQTSNLPPLTSTWYCHLIIIPSITRLSTIVFSHSLTIDYTRKIIHDTRLTYSLTAAYLSRSTLPTIPLRPPASVQRPNPTATPNLESDPLHIIILLRLCRFLFSHPIQYCSECHAFGLYSAWPLQLDL